MAQTVHLFLKANGNEIKGNSEQVTLGRKDTIELKEFHSSVITPRDPATGKATGRRRCCPLGGTCDLGEQTVYLMKALTCNEVVSGKFMFFDCDEKGEDRNVYTIEFEGGHIDFIEYMSPDVTDPAAAYQKARERFGITYEKVRYIYNPTGVEHEDSWSGQS